MKTGWTAFVLGAALVVNVPQDVRIRWQAAGGPIAGPQKRVIVQQGSILLVNTSPSWRSSDGGMTWQRPLRDMPGPWTVSAGGPELFGDGPDGVFRSSDMGLSWTQCGALPVNSRSGNAVTSIEADERRVFVSIHRIGLLRSEDRCTTWSDVAAPWTRDFPPSIKYVDGSRVIVRALGGSFLSVDAGRTWVVMAGDVSEPITFTKDCDGAMLAGTGHGVFRSRDDGRSWTLVGLDRRWVAALATPACDAMFAVVQDLGRWTHSVLRSADRGATWTPAGDGLTGHRIHDLSLDERGTVYASGHAGAFRWAREGRWQQLGPADAAVANLVAAPWGEVFAATGGLGLFRATGAVGPWRLSLLGHDAHVSPHPPGDAFAYSAVVTRQGDLLVGAQHGVLRSQDRGETWRRVGLTRTVLTFLPTSSGSILAGTDNGIFRSTDGGESWVERSIGLSAFKISSLAAAADGAVYVGTWEGEVFRSTDEGERWRSLPPLGMNPVHALVVLKNGDLLAGSHSGLFRWATGERSWRRLPLSGQRPMVAVRALVQDASGLVFAGSEGDGVFVSRDEGTSWLPANDGLTVNTVLSLAVDAAGHVAAGTSGGVFRAAIVNVGR